MSYLEKHAKKMSNTSRAALIGSGIGAITGAGVGAIDSYRKGGGYAKNMLIGGGSGAALGAGFGALGSKVKKSRDDLRESSRRLGESVNKVNAAFDDFGAEQRTTDRATGGLR